MRIEYPIRLQSYLAKSGFGSRRSCEKLIADGRVTVNMKIVTEMGTKVDADDVVMVDTQLAEPADRLFYYALHKPRGYVCTNYDPHEKLYARDLITIPESNLLFHIGRLDKDSTGLILYTNDGTTAQKIMHPSQEIEKEYAVMTTKAILREDLEEALRGVYIDSQRPYIIKKFTLRSKRWALITLTEGRNRELRKIFSYFGYTIQRLVRIRIGPIQLGDLAEGRYRIVSKAEIKALLEGKNS
ncbi:MAG: pseudouridine synthase [Sphaerochaetaceae bacterium]|jgi:23S rRNA pseudouridine2605 synthase|nr:pseudouridine synthase [Sphaerochaetaceae bacterium]MDD3366464.1 pseudouridine synthase [Sphaerochaetaceae bacterium]MDD4219578.1 pseudouridine synthase [Sphaerochaetaceae bacterium]MDY0372161.1 pseudouridine synthase [Sphaerochaetaceae bacterium]